MRERQLREIASADHADEHRDHGLERPEPPALEAEDREGRDARQDGRREEGEAEQEVEPDRRAEELGEVGRHRDRLRLEPEQDRRPPRRAARAQTSGRLRPVAIPSFAESVWISIAIRFAATITHTSW